jgi:hypothetical protein
MSSTSGGRHALLLGAALWLAGCANLDTIAPGTPAADIAASRGKPYRIWPETGGAASWEYPLGPRGSYTYMVRVGVDGRITRVDQVLGWPFFNQLKPGMNAREIEHVLGRPYSRTHMPLLNEDVLAWRWIETVWPRCFYAYMSPEGTLRRTGVRDEEISEHGVLTAEPC